MLWENWKLSAPIESFIENLVSAKDKHSPCSLDSFHPASRGLSKQLAVCNPTLGQVCARSMAIWSRIYHRNPDGLAQHNGPPGC